MKKAYFQYYETFEKIVQKFKSEADQNAFRQKIVEYGLFGTEPELNELENMVWDVVKDMIDSQQHRREVNAANRVGKKAEPATAEENSVTAPQPEEKPAQEIQLEKPKTVKKKEAPFIPPTKEEVDAYCKERRNGITGEQFVEYYTNKQRPWTIGNQKEPMKDWRAAVRQWERTERKTNNKAAGTMWANNSTDADTAVYEVLF